MKGCRGPSLLMYCKDDAIGRLLVLCRARNTLSGRSGKPDTYARDILYILYNMLRQPAPGLSSFHR